MSFLFPMRVHLLWLAVALVGLLAWLELGGGDALGRFVSRVMALRLAYRPTRRRRIVRLALIFAALALGVIALMRPQTRSATRTVAATRIAADIMVVLDVSKSMLADDAAPTRLERARAEIADMVAKLHGHRVGLTAFAGRASVLCPLTADYGFFNLVLKTAEPRSVARGGTRIGEAIRAGVRAFGPGTGARMILLITDGEDHDSYPKDAAKEARLAGVRIVAIGFGSEEGSPISVTDPKTGASTLVVDKSGQTVRSRLDGELLREIALETEGAYVPAGVAALDLESIVEQHLMPIARAAAAPSVRVIPGEQYPWLVLGSLVCLLLAVWVGSSPGPRPRRSA